jgi:hypothetical protein
VFIFYGILAAIALGVLAVGLCTLACAGVLYLLVREDRKALGLMGEDAPPSALVADEMAPEVIEAAKLHRKVRALPFKNTILGWLVPIALRFFIEFLIGAYGRLGGEVLTDLRAFLVRNVFSPAQTVRYDRLISLAKQPVATFAPEMRVRGLELASGYASQIRPGYVPGGLAGELP